MRDQSPDTHETDPHDTDDRSEPEPTAGGDDPPLDIDPETEETVRAARRDVLKAVGGAGVGMGLTHRIEEFLAGPEDTRPPDDPHTVATFRALVDLVVPETPDLAAELGEEHRAGGLNVDAERVTIGFLDSAITLAIPPANDDTGAPLSEALADLMDAGASALLAQGENTSPPDPTRFEGGGPFASLSRVDRRRALARLERQDDLQLIVTVLVVAPMLLYYSERTGYADFGAPPGERGFTGAVQSWEQTDYPGPANGYAALRGYEVEEQTDEFDVGDRETRGPPAETPAAERSPGNAGGGNGDEGTTDDGSADSETTDDGPKEVPTGTRRVVENAGGDRR
jgi:hypothetical protein